MLCFRQEQFVAFLIKQEDFFFPDLVDLGSDYRADHFRIFGIEAVFLQLQNLGGQCLSQVEDSPTAELQEIHLVSHVLANLIRFIYLLSLAERDLAVRVGDFVIGDDFPVPIYLKVPFIRVYDNIIVVIRAEHFGNHASERFLQHTDHCRAVNVLKVFEF